MTEKTSLTEGECRDIYLNVCIVESIFCIRTAISDHDRAE